MKVITRLAIKKKTTNKGDVMKKIIIILVISAGFLFSQTTEEPKGTDTFLGEIMLFAGDFTPVGYLPCDGRLVNISQYSALFSLLGTQYGGNGITTFGLPDLRGRVPMGSGTGTGLTSRSIGEMGGYESVTLSESQLPPHTHSLGDNITGQLMCSTAEGQDDSPAGNCLAVSEQNMYVSGTPDTPMNSAGVTIQGSINSAGMGLGHNNMQPYLVLHYCIAVSGVYPLRP